jgi:phage terminase large subunit
MRFDKTKCQAGLDALGWYHEKKDEDRDIGLGPEHDWASHSADAFGLGCVAYEEPRKARQLPPTRTDWVV